MKVYNIKNDVLYKYSRTARALQNQNTASFDKVLTQAAEEFSEAKKISGPDPVFAGVFGNFKSSGQDVLLASSAQDFFNRSKLISSRPDPIFREADAT